MDELSALLRAATDDPPPTSIDVDRLLDTEHRRRRRVTLTAVGGGLAVLALLGSLGLALRPTGPQIPAVVAPAPCVHDTDGPPVDRQAKPLRTPAEAHDAAVTRLTGALPGLLPAGARALTCPRVEFRWDEGRAQYQATAWIGDVSLVVMLRPRDRGEQEHCLLSGLACSRTELAGGAVAMHDQFDLGPDGKVQRSATVYRPDGTRAMLVTIGRPADLLSDDRLAAIGRDPALTLYP